MREDSHSKTNSETEAYRKQVVDEKERLVSVSRILPSQEKNHKKYKILTDLFNSGWNKQLNTKYVVTRLISAHLVITDLIFAQFHPL